MEPSTPDPMVTLSGGELTGLLQLARSGDDAAMQRFVTRVYTELRQTARRLLRQEHGDMTLATTDVVHEAYFRLFGDDADWENRRHFFGSAARAMRRTLIDHARARQAAKRQQTPTVDAQLQEDARVDSLGIDLLALDAALDKLSQLNERQARIVELKYFAGLSDSETASVLDVSRMTVHRDWQVAKLRLQRYMSE